MIPGREETLRLDGAAWITVDPDVLRLWDGELRTPKAAIDRLNREISAIVESPEMKKKLQEQGVEADPMTPDELAALFKGETAKWAKVIKDSKIQAE